VPWGSITGPPKVGRRRSQERSAMSDKKDAEKAKAPMLPDVFGAIRGRLPESDRELEEWLASDEGKAATMFEFVPVIRWGEGRS
jgi:hypothetical protein